jgi:serine/threonine protein kinase
MTSPLTSDRNLLFGLYALELNHVGPEDLLDAMRGWSSLGGTRSLADVLVARKRITLEQRQEVEKALQLRLPPSPSPPSEESTVVHTPLPAPMRFDRRELHAKGGLGLVYRANDRELDRIVALKEIRDDRADEASYRERFVLEGRITGRLEHPGVVPVYGLGRYADGRPYYAMRFIKGETLSDAIRALHETKPPEGQQTPERSLALRRLLGRFLSICQTMAYAHSRGMIHRDLKPANVMLGPFGETIVVDWGIAKVLADAEHPASELPFPSSGSNTAAGAVGTRPYMSPEQAEGRLADHGVATDVYLLGGILHEILTGQPPHPGGKRCEGAPSPRSIDPHVAPELDAITRKALQVNPRERYECAADLAADIERWLADEPLAAYRWLIRGLEQQHAATPGSPELRDVLARHRVTLGLVLAGMDRLREAEDLLRQAVGDYHALATVSQDVRPQAEQATALAHLAGVMSRLGRGADAQVAQAEANQIYDRLRQRHPEQFRIHMPNLIEATMHGLDPRAVPIVQPEQEAVMLPGPEPSRTSEPGARPPSPTEPPVTTGDPNRTDEFLRDPSHPGPGAYVPPAIEGATLQFEHRLSNVRLLGQGGAGEVLLATDEVFGREVAIKVLAIRYQTSQESHRRFRREARITARLQHPAIVPVYASGTLSTDGSPFFLMRYVPGPTLSMAAEQLLSEVGAKARFRSSRFHRLLLAFADICRALQHAHERGFIHRDPKPANIIVSDAGQGVLIDWGLARPLGEADDPPPPDDSTGAGDDVCLTQEGTIVGTPVYMAPEMARGQTHLIDARTDIYGAGASLFHLLTGQPPRTGATAIDILRSVISGTGMIRRPRQVEPAVPKALDEICAKAMAHQREDRYQNAADLANAVERWIIANTPRGN